MRWRQMKVEIQMREDDALGKSIAVKTEKHEWVQG